MLIPTTTSSGWITKSGTAQLRQETLRLRNTRSDEAFLRTLQKNQEWVDLELLLRELNELGARPLLLSMPIHGGWYDQCGVTYTARRAYYEKLRGISARYHAPVVDFADHDADQSFCHDHHGAPRSQWIGVLQPGPRRFLPRRDPLQSELPPLHRGERGTGPVSPSDARVPTASKVSTILRAIQDRASGRTPTTSGRKVMSLEIKCNDCVR